MKEAVRATPGQVEALPQTQGAGRSASGRRQPRPDPPPRAVAFPFISVDDHVVEPPDLFEGRLPRSLAERAPSFVQGNEGSDYWLFDGERIPFSGSNVVASWEVEDWTFDPVALDEARPGTWDVHQRVKDMDVNGVVASLNFPSMVIGFAGQRFMRIGDPELGFAAMQAYNDWVLESWTSPHPDRIIPCQVPWLPDPDVAAAEIRRNAARGFRAVAFTENPEKLGLPSLYSGRWDPFFRACEETETVINLHVGSSSQTVVPSTESPPPVHSLLFPVNGLVATVDWLYARVPLRFPEIKVVFSEGGIGWLPMLLDRIRYQAGFFKSSGLGDYWADTSISPEEALKRNFWFTTFYDPSGFALLEEVGVENVMLEADYPHGDTTWPDSQDLIAAQLAGAPDDVTSTLAWRNAARLYQHSFDFASVTSGMRLERPLSSSWFASSAH